METPPTPPAAGAGAAAGGGATEVDTGRRRRDFTPLEERSERIHQWVGRVRAATDEATAGGVHGVRLGTLNAREAGECALELGRVIAQLQGLRAMCLAAADAGGVARLEAAGP